MRESACSLRPNADSNAWTRWKRSFLLASELGRESWAAKSSASFTVNEPMKVSSCSTKELSWRSWPADGVFPLIKRV